MKSFSTLVFLVGIFALTACHNDKPFPYEAVPGYAAPRSIKQIEQEDSWKQKADQIMMLAQAEEQAPVKPVLEKIEKKTVSLAKHTLKKQSRKISSQKNNRLKFVAFHPKAKSRHKAVPVF